jgi:hypothetical protein
MPATAYKVNTERSSSYRKFGPANDNPTKPQPYVSSDTKERAKDITAARGGEWNDEKGAGRKLKCFVCDELDMAVTAKTKGVLMCCNSCGAGMRDKVLFEAAIAAGFDCGPGPARRRPDLKLRPASDDMLYGLKPAARRVLAFCAAKTSTRDWVEVSQAEVVPTCHISCRGFTLNLRRLAERGLIRVRSNNYAVKRRTQIGFLVDPVDLAGRIELSRKMV